MKLFQVTDEFWTNPDKISAVYISTQCPPAGTTIKTYYALMIDVAGGYLPHCLHTYETKEEALEHLQALVDHIKATGESE